MDESSGWVKLYRQTLDNPVVCKDTETFAVWCYLLLMAAHKQRKVLFNNGVVELDEGQLITGRKAISEKFYISESKVQRILKLLESEHQIEQQTSSKNRLISIVNWHKYQSSEHQIEQQVNNERTTSEQQVNTNKNVRMQEESYYYYKDKKTDRKSEAVASLFSKNLFAMLSGYGMSKEEFINAGYEKIDNLKDYQKALFDYKEKNGVE